MISQGSPPKAVRSLEQILIDFARNKPDQFPDFFKRARRAYSREVTRACIRYLAEQDEHDSDASGRQMIIWLSAGSDYLDIILDHKFTQFEVAQKLFTLFRQKDPQFAMKLSEIIDRPETLAVNLLLRRALKILETIDNLPSFVRWLQRLTYRQDERIRSKAVKLICGIGLSANFMQRSLGSEDGRVRANTVEAFWGRTAQEAEAIFLGALHDEHHRVVANAIVGLYPINKDLALERLNHMTEHASPMFRLAAAWTIEKIGDGKIVEWLQRLIQDDSPAVRRRAETTLAKLQAQEAAVSEGAVLSS
jgi:HEAT repeat protein